MNISKIIIFLLFLPYICINSITVHNCKKLWGVANKINGITLSDMNLYICIDDPYNLYNNNDQFTSSIELNSAGGESESVTTTLSPLSPINQKNKSNISNVSHINITNITNITNILTSSTSSPTTTTIPPIPTTTYLRAKNVTSTTISPTTFSPSSTTTTQNPNQNIPDNQNNNDIITVIKNVTINTTTLTFQNDISSLPTQNLETIEDNTPIIIILSVVGGLIIIGCWVGGYILWKRKNLKIKDNDVPKIPQPLYNKNKPQKLKTQFNTRPNARSNRRIKPKTNIKSPPIIMSKSPSNKKVPRKSLQKKEFKPQKIPTYDVTLTQNVPRELTPKTKDALHDNGGEDWYKDTFSEELGLDPPPGPPPLVNANVPNFDPPVVPKRNFKSSVRKVGIANGIKQQVNKFDKNNANKFNNNY